MQRILILALIGSMLIGCPFHAKPPTPSPQPTASPEPDRTDYSILKCTKSRTMTNQQWEFIVKIIRKRNPDQISKIIDSKYLIVTERNEGFLNEDGEPEFQSTSSVTRREFLDAVKTAKYGRYLDRGEVQVLDGKAYWGALWDCVSYCVVDFKRPGEIWIYGEIDFDGIHLGHIDITKVNMDDLRKKAAVRVRKNPKEYIARRRNYDLKVLYGSENGSFVITGVEYVTAQND